MFAKKMPWKIRLIVLWSLFMLPLLIYLVYVISTYEIAKISNLSVEYMRNGQMTFSEVIPAGVNRLFACGRITTRGSNYLVITLHNVDEEQYYGKSDSNKPFPSGDFCSEIILDGPLGPGFYKIIVIDSHKRVGELVFQVK